MDEIIVRDMVPTDGPFILSTWLGSFRTTAFPGGVELSKAGKQFTTHSKHLKGGHRTVSDDVKHVALSICDNIYFAEQTKLIKSLLVDPRTTVKVLCAADDVDTIVGYICAWQSTPVIVHWMYIRPELRKMKLSHSLLSAVGHTTGSALFFTHAPSHDIRSDGSIKSRWRTDHAMKHDEWVYDPYILRGV